jgi:hypothetical protein
MSDLSLIKAVSAFSTNRRANVKLVKWPAGSALIVRPFRHPVVEGFCLRQNRKVYERRAASWVSSRAGAQGLACRAAGTCFVFPFRTFHSNEVFGLRATRNNISNPALKAFKVHRRLRTAYTVL